MLILYNPPSSARRKPVLPMALLALGALLEDEHAYVIVDGNLERDSVETLDCLVREQKATMLGVTVMGGPQLQHAVRVSSTLKAKHPDLTILWGGYFPTQHYEVCLRANYVDYVVRGHGEVVFKALLDALKQGEDATKIAGVAFQHAETGEVISNPLAPIPNPDSLPDFPYHRVDVPRYVRPTFLGKRTLPHHSSYGCPFLCNFCAVVNMVNGRWLAQSAERTAQVVQRLVKNWAVDAVEFYDNNFFVHEARTEAFAEQIRSLNLAWWGEARIDTMLKYTDRTWALMRDSGLKMVFLGAESGSDETLQRMNKGGKASTDKTLEIAGKMKHYGIVPEFSFVLGNPPDPEADMHQTLAFIRKLKRINPHAEIILYLYTPVPLAGTLYEQAKAEGFQFPETLEAWISPGWQDFAQRRSAHVPWVKDPLRQKVRNFERVLNAYYPTVTDRKLTGVKRSLLRALGGWRYKTQFYTFPIELRAFHKLFSYQRPETTGF